MNQLIRLLTVRFGVLRTWSSVGRVAVWTLIWAVVVSLVVAPARPTPAEREHVPDSPESTVRYLGPTSHQDLAGFIAPPDLDDTFTVAWIGGSEVKLREVSVPGEVSRRVSSFGTEAIQMDAYTVVAPRYIDAIRAIDSALANNADALVISLNTAWVADEWSMREWPNLDSANLGLLWSNRSTWPWAASLTSPADVAWRASRAVLPIVESQNRLNQHGQDLIDAIDIVDRPVTDSAVGPVLDDPRLPIDQTSFWLVQKYGPSILDDTTVRVAAMAQGLDPETSVADFFARLLVQTVEAADIPVFIYPTPIDPTVLADPAFQPAAERTEAYWQRIAERVTSELVEFESRSLSLDFISAPAYYDLVHMADAAPHAEVLSVRLCALWHRSEPTKECS